MLAMPVMPPVDRGDGYPCDEIANLSSLISASNIARIAGTAGDAIVRSRSWPSVQRN